jgi:hypothetical protein
MLESADQIIGLLKIGALLADADLSSTNAESIGVSKLVTKLSSAGAETRTLQNGAEGQVKILAMTTYIATGIVVTPASFASTSIAFDSVLKTWIGIFLNGKWRTLGGTATVT